MLSWLCVLAKPLGTHAKASLPCSPLPLHQSLLFPLIFAKEHLSLALLAPPVTPSLSIPTTFSKAHQPLRPAPRPCLPSKKVRCCHPKKFGRLPEGLLPIRTINEIFRTIPSTKLASLVKGRWLDGKAQALILLLSVCDTPTFFIYQTFLPSRRRDSFTPTNLSKTALSHPLFVGRASVFTYTVLHLNYHISLFVGEWACPSRNITAIIKNKLIEL